MKSNTGALQHCIVFNCGICVSIITLRFGKIKWLQKLLSYIFLDLEVSFVHWEMGHKRNYNNAMIVCRGFVSWVDHIVSFPNKITKYVMCFLSAEILL